MLSLVGLVMAAGIGTYLLARADGPMDVVPDPVQRTGQAQLADLDPDTRAAHAGLSAIARIDPEHGLVEVLPVTGDFDHAAPMHLRLQHPTRADADLLLTLSPHETGWRAVARPATGHDWLLQLSPAQAPVWRLRGRLPKGQRAVHLAPAVSDAQPVHP
jgi:hypothetical protein